MYSNANSLWNWGTRLNHVYSFTKLLNSKETSTQLSTVLYKWKEITWGVSLRWILPGVKEFAKLNPCNKLNNMPPKYSGRFWSVHNTDRKVDHKIKIKNNYWTYYSRVEVDSCILQFHLWISSYVMSSEFTREVVMKFLPPQFSWIGCECLQSNFIHSKIFQSDRI